MSKIFDLISGHGQYMTIAIYVIILSLVVTFIVNFVAKNLKFAKYLPGMALICIGMFSFLTVINDLFNPDNLSNLAIFVIGSASGIISLLFALIIGIIQSGKE
ncbi:cytochrome C biosynthesis protein [Anaerosphaera multitolerans]|uniref:Cytochrome C biosynthesis protein n=1 Tax=Anaerosphaera multitolerans TaxID=2487351 RepID=A0A437S7L2_9FIRM|nr:cytochrome C biosynthesis protein [Anaerosphaera multitolerans]RVU54934.1 cytochrome C biosynthesis protein [Anaerosphaera multitolerans]